MTLDAGILIAIDRNERRGWLLRAARVERGMRLTVPAGALAQAWRGSRSVRISRFLQYCEIAPLDEFIARRSGDLCAKTRTSDVVDASIVATAAARGEMIVTSDVKDMGALAASARVPVVDFGTL